MNNSLNDRTGDIGDGMFTELAGGNIWLRNKIEYVRKVWQKHANRRTLIILIFILTALLGVYMYGLRAPVDFPTNQLITIRQGSGVDEIANKLESNHIIRSARVFKIIARITRLDKNLHSGDYIFKDPIIATRVLSRIAHGEFGLDPVTVRIKDGMTAKNIADVLDGKIMRFDKKAFLALASKYEGYLYPDTYFFLPNAHNEQIVGAMRDNFDKHFKKLTGDTTPTGQYNGLSEHDLITLASIVELEASKYEDRRKIAGVMYNRLKKGMPLQVDVSFKYIMNKGTFDITLEDLKHKSPYNTYNHKGLPPGPICSPSESAIKATLHPYKSNWLYYLADKRGVTHYSSTYKEHLRKKRWYIDKHR